MTFLEIQNTVRAELDLDASRYSPTELKRHINEVIHALEEEIDHPWAEDRDTFDTVADQEEYEQADFDGNASLVFVAPIQIYFESALSGGQVNLELKPYKFVRATYPQLETDSAEPKLYTMWQDKIVLAPAPDDVYSMSIDFLGKQADLVADGDTNPWTLHASTLVIARTKIKAARFSLEFSVLGELKEDAEDNLDKLVVSLSERFNAGSRPESEEY